MSFRTRFLITAAFLCHLLLALPVVTSQLRSPGETVPPPDSAAQAPSTRPCPTPAVAAKENITICALQQEKDGPVYKLHGNVEIHYRTFVLYADEITYNSDSDDASAEGHMVLEGGENDEHITASHGTYNISNESGRFYDVVGTTGVLFRGNRVILTSSSPFAFTGKTVEKTAPDHYVVYDGTVTTCELPHPNWKFDAHRVVVDVGGNAKIYRSAFLLHGIPVFYFPFATHPVEHLGRQSGFLTPTIGRSSIKGTVLGDAFYWAIDRTMDATVGAQYFSLRGWSQHGELRARPSDTSFLDLNYFGVIDRGIGTPPLKEGGENVRLSGAGLFGDGFRGVANIDYLSSFVFRLAFNEVFSQAVYSEVKSQAFLSKSVDGLSFNALTERYQNFESTTPGDVVTILHAPSFAVSSVDEALGRSPFYWSFDAAAEGLSRSEPGFRTGNLLGRFDLNPTLSLPLVFRGWSLRPELTLHDTFYTERLLPNTGTGFAANNPVNRQALEGAVELRPPALARVFDREFLGRKWKHVIEPRATYRYVTGVNNFENILRFDERDILSDTHEVEYALVNRLYAKRTAARPEDCSSTGMTALAIGAAAPQVTVPWERVAGPQNIPCTSGPQVREVVTWELAQKYFLDPTFGGAVVPGTRNVFTTTADFTGIAFLTEPRHLSPLISRLRIETSARTDSEWDVDYDFQRRTINASTVLVNYHFGPFTLAGGDAFLRPAGETLLVPPFSPLEFHQFRVGVGYGHPNKRGFSVANSFGFDADSGFLQFATVQTTYNWDCCGVNLEYRRFALGSVRNENRYTFSFTLANIGGFGNLKRQERLY